MNAKVRQQLKNRKQRIARRLVRIDRGASELPELAASNIRYEVADRTRTQKGLKMDRHLLDGWVPGE